MLWLIAFVAFSVFIYVEFIKPLNIWKENNVPYKKPWPIVGNSAREVFGFVSFIDGILDIYNDFKDKRYNGYFQFSQPILVVRDVELIKQITVKNFDHFTNHWLSINEDLDDLFSKNLFVMKEQPWKEMRSIMSPIFTSSKLKGMYPIMNECAQKFTEYYLKKKEKLIEIDAKDAFSRFANDVIASTAFGVKCDSLEDKNNEFYLAGKNITASDGVQAFRFILANKFPTFMKALNIHIFPKKIENYFKRIIKNNIYQRKEKRIVRQDLIHLLTQARKRLLKRKLNSDAGFAAVQEFDCGKSTSKNLELTDDLITAQALIFFAGLDSISSTASFVLYELALNPDVQDTLRKEIDGAFVKSNGTLSYDQLLKLKYLDMVVSETLRKWPPEVIVDRACVKDFTIEPQIEGETAYKVKKGDIVLIPVFGLHRDSKYYPNPEKFDPERFSDENKHNILPCSYIPFGSGPRACIGSKFALLEMKLILAHIISKFTIEVTEKTPIPFKFPRRCFSLHVEGSAWIGLKPR